MAEKSRASKRSLSILIAFLMLLSSFLFMSFTALAEETEDLPEPPVLLSVTNTFNGINISWKKVDGAEQYRVFYKTEASEWTKIADTASASYTWTEAVSGTDYSFTVCCVNADGSEITSEYDPVGLSITYIAAPKLSSIEANNSGVVIKWAETAGAEKYRVFYKTQGGGWKRVADTTSNSYTWSGAQIGTEYTYTVRCITGDGKSYTSSYDSTGLSFTALSKPQLSSVTNVANGVEISWDKVKGAEKYRVYYKTSGGSWTKIDDTTSTSYTWTGAKSDTKYTFTVRCLTSDVKSFTSGYDSTGKSLTYIAAPKLSSVDYTSTGIKIEWGKVKGAEKYRVYYKIGSGEWTKIGDTTSASYTWNGAKSGTTYRFTVRCISNDAKSHTSGYDATGMTIDYIAAPKLISANAVSSGIQITWDKSKGAEKYRVYYKVPGASWTKIDDTTSNSYTWTKAAIGTKYTFTVRCINSSGSTHTSSYDGTGLSLTYVSTPKLSSATSTNSGIQIKWGKVTGAEKYRVYYKISSNDWLKIGETTSTSYTWNSPISGKQYTFTVRCISSDGKSHASYFDTAGITTTFSGASLNSKANSASEKYSNCTRYIYGTSEMGYQLESYIIKGNGSNNRIIFMDFAVHGYEDEYAKDGKVLVTLGNGLVEYYSAHPELLGNYMLVIVPCANPDGTMFGKNNYRADKANAFGRCTYKGIDINRDFKSGGFKAVESVALRNLMNKYKPNVYLNFHGWEDSVIGDPQLVSIFRSNVGITTDKSNKYGSDQGYIIGYVKPTYNAKAALVEFRNSKSVSQDKVIKAINKIISNRL